MKVHVLHLIISLKSYFTADPLHFFHDIHIEEAFVLHTCPTIISS